MEDGQLERIIPPTQLERLIVNKFISKIEKEHYLYCIKGLSRYIVSKSSDNPYAIDSIYKTWMRDKDFPLMDFFYLEDSLEKQIIDHELGYSTLHDPNYNLFRIDPHSQINISNIIEFKPSEPKIYSKTLVIKNNLTGIETITLIGIGASVDLYFERKQSESNLTKKIVLDLALDPNEDYTNFFVNQNFSIKNFGILPIAISNVSTGNSFCGDESFRILNCHPFYIDSGKEHMFFIRVEISNRKKIKRDLKLFVDDNIMIVNFSIEILNSKEVLSLYYLKHAMSINSKILLSIVIGLLVVWRTCRNTSLLRRGKKTKTILQSNTTEEQYLHLEENSFLPIKKPKVRNIDFFTFKADDEAALKENRSDKSSSMDKQSSSCFFNESFEVITEEINNYHGNIGPKKKDSEEEKTENISNSKRSNLYDYFYGKSNMVDFDISALREENEG